MSDAPRTAPAPFEVDGKEYVVAPLTHRDQQTLTFMAARANTHTGVVRDEYEVGYISLGGETRG